MIDEHGEYRVLHRFVDRWTGPIAGWCVCEVREYLPVQIAGVLTMQVRIARGDARYDHSEPDLVAIARVYRIASDALGART